MTTTVEAIYQNGVLKPQTPLNLPENVLLLVTIQSQPEDDADRRAWLQLSQAALLKTWDNSDDDVFNELLKK
jgi:predicted DNA-binding antitoxin AbrB/MazE fold protein